VWPLEDVGRGRRPSSREPEDRTELRDRPPRERLERRPAHSPRLRPLLPGEDFGQAQALLAPFGEGLRDPAAKRRGRVVSGLVLAAGGSEERALGLAGEAARLDHEPRRILGGPRIGGVEGLLNLGRELGGPGSGPFGQPDEVGATGFFGEPPEGLVPVDPGQLILPRERPGPARRVLVCPRLKISIG
jgi:hypothetical protein